MHLRDERAGVRWVVAAAATAAAAAVVVVVLGWAWVGSDYADDSNEKKKNTT